MSIPVIACCVAICVAFFLVVAVTGRYPWDRR